MAKQIEAIERAIEVLEKMRHWESVDCHDEQGALATALAALRAQSERMKGCGICHDQTATITGFRYWKTNTAVMEQSFGAAFCPKCGRRLEAHHE